MKTVKTAVVALALGMSECDIRDRFEGAKEIEFSEAFKLMENPKIKRYNEEAKVLKDKLVKFGELMEGLK